MTASFGPVTVVLASASPRRQTFLRALGLQFEVVTADITETRWPHETPAQMVTRLAREKGHAVAGMPALRHVPALIITADTSVALGEQELGKPTDAAEAVSMLQRLRNRTHAVHTAVCLLNTTTGGQPCRLNTSHVVMRSYSSAEVAAYVASGDPLDKAGAYAIQHRAFAPVQRLDGCAAGVMGLPLHDLRLLLQDAGFDFPQPLVLTCSWLTGFPCCQVGR